MTRRTLLAAGIAARLARTAPSRLKIGITDWTTLIGTHERITIESVARIGRIDAPTPPSRMKNAITMSWAPIDTRRRAGHASVSTSSGQPM